MIRSLHVHNVRSYKLFSAEFDSKVTLILGSNGSGKTTLLEALYFLQRGTSFRGRDLDLIAHSAPRADIKLETGNGEQRRVRLEKKTESSLNREFTIGGKRSARLGSRLRLPVVLFEPDELRLLTSSPQRRRQFIDGFLSRLSPSYSTSLARLNRILLQRNELLKQQRTLPVRTWENHLFAWDVKFAELATGIAETRRQFIATSNQHLSRLYSSMAGHKALVTARYDSTLPEDNYQQRLLSVLQQHRYDDALRGFTTVGPHRDDITLLLNGHPAGETASRGEMRTIMLAFKLLEVELQEKTSGQPPLILMDDVFSELDIGREKKLMHALSGYQTVITATDLRDELKINASIINL